MHPGEVEVMARVEAEHWWYRGLRDAIARSLAQPDLALPAAPRILDAGCGTGENLRSLFAPLHPAYLGGFDLSPEALAAARVKAPTADLYLGDICAPELRAGDLDLVASLDVIYIPGVARALPGLRRLSEALRPGGLLLLNLPAFDWLYSEHDVAVHTSERFTARKVRALFDALGLEVARLSYRLFLLFPAIAASRIAHKRRAAVRPQDARSDLHQPPGALASRALLASLRAENRLIARGVRLPWGSSVFAIGRKPRAGAAPPR